MDIRQLNEKMDKLFEEEKYDRVEFCKKFEQVVETEFRPIGQKLVDMVREFKEKYPDENEYSLPQDISSKIDMLALCAERIYGLLNGNRKNR